MRACGAGSAAYITLGAAMWFFIIPIVVLSFVIGFLKTGSVQGAVFVSAWTAPFALIAGYFASRSRQQPSRTERVLARTWLFFRRAVCFVGATCMGVLSAGMLVSAVTKHDSGAAFASGFFLLLCGVFVWWGIYGAGYRRTFSDDRPVHEERRKRYGWK